MGVDGKGKRDSNIPGRKMSGWIGPCNNRRKILPVDRGENEENTYQSIEEIMRG